LKINVVESEHEGKGDEEFSGLDAVFHTEACAFDKDDFGVVEKAVEDGGGNGAVAVEDCGPLLEGFVGGEHDGAALVALADDLEEEVCATLIDGKITELIKEEDGWGEIFAQFGFENKRGASTATAPSGCG
jgi:hypothetical protein